MAEEQAAQAVETSADLVESEDKGGGATTVQLKGYAMYLNYHRLRSMPLELFDADVCSTLHRLYLKYNLLQSVVLNVKRVEPACLMSSRPDSLPLS